MIRILKSLISISDANTDRYSPSGLKVPMSARRRR